MLVEGSLDMGFKYQSMPWKFSRNMVIRVAIGLDIQVWTQLILFIHNSSRIAISWMSTGNVDTRISLFPEYLY